MRQLCVKHGDGKSWYLEASNYAFDLDADLKRREYLLDFVKDFGNSRESALTNLARWRGCQRRCATLAGASRRTG